MYAVPIQLFLLKCKAIELSILKISRQGGIANLSIGTEFRNNVIVNIQYSPSLAVYGKHNADAVYCIQNTMFLNY